MRGANNCTGVLNDAIVDGTDIAEGTVGTVTCGACIERFYYVLLNIDTTTGNIDNNIIIIA